MATDQDRQGLLMPKEMRERTSLPQVAVPPAARGSMSGSGSHFTTTGESLPSPLSMTSHGHHGAHSSSRSHSADNEDNDNDSEMDYMDNDDRNKEEEEEDEEEEIERMRPMVRSPRRHNLHQGNHSHYRNTKRDDYDNDITDNVLLSSILSSARPPGGVKATNRSVVRDNRPAGIDTNADHLHEQRRQANAATASYALLLDFGPESVRILL